MGVVRVTRRLDAVEPRPEAADSSLAEQALKLTADISPRLGEIEAERVKRRKNPDLKPDDASKSPDRADSPGNPGSGHRSLMFQAGKSQELIETDDAAGRAAEGIRSSDAGSLLASAEHVSHSALSGGALRLTPAQERELADAAQGASKEGFLRGGAAALHGRERQDALFRISAGLDGIKSDAENTANPFDIQSGVEDIAGVIESIASKERQRRAVKPLEGRLLADAAALRHLLRGLPGLDDAAIVQAAADASLKLEAVSGEKVEPVTVLAETLQVAGGRPGGEYSDMMLRELIIKYRGKRDPDIVALMEGLFSEGGRREAA
jgi:hypothetical protein